MAVTDVVNKLANASRDLDTRKSIVSSPVAIQSAFGNAIHPTLLSAILRTAEFAVVLST